MLSAVVAPLLAATIQAYRLPVGFTVLPEAETRQIRIARDGTIVALAQATDRTDRVRAFRWNGAGDLTVFTPLTVLTQPDPHSTNPSYPESVAAGNAIYVTAATSWSGGYSGTSTQVERWTPHGAARWALPACVQSNGEQDQHAYGVDADGRIAITMDITGDGSFEVLSDTNGYYAPYAYVVRGGSCRNLGRGVVNAVRGQWAAGYRGYLDGHLAPDNLNTIVQTTKSVRWYGAMQLSLAAATRWL